MNRFIITIGIGVVFVTHALCSEEVMNATEATKKTQKNTQKLKEELMGGDRGKLAYKLFMKAVNDGIVAITSKGYYNSLNLNTINSKQLKEIEDILPQNLELEILKDIVEQKLIEKGYRVQRGKYDYAGSTHFVISWGK